ncbi:hypothetical protein N7486_005860 [Penicillium sp. IBT 16267x]|nr:hypothetical protein N7486_005860 [Penicillium sp. IBT 16267x]
MSEFGIYIPKNLSFQDYIAITKISRVWADGYDSKDYARLFSTLAPNVAVDYTLGEKHYTSSDFATEWLSAEHLGHPALVMQHLLALPYFKSVKEDEIIVQWQQLVSQGRREDQINGGPGKISETSDGRSWMEHRFVKVEGEWKIAGITPSVLFLTGDWQRIRRPVEES